MNYKLIISGLISSAILLVPGISVAKFSDFKFTPYVGLDHGIQQIGFETGYGDNLFSKTLPKSNFFVGLKFNDYFGIEGGYESTDTGRRTALVVTGDRNLGIPVTAFSAKYNTIIKLSGWHLGFTGEFPLTILNNSNKFSILCYAGLKYATIKLIRNRIEVNWQPSIYSDNLNINNKKYLAKLLGGLQYLLNKNIGIRALVALEKTSKLRPYTFAANNNTLTAKPKNSISYNVGMVLKY